MPQKNALVQCFERGHFHFPCLNPKFRKKPIIMDSPLHSFLWQIAHFLKNT